MYKALGLNHLGYHKPLPEAAEAAVKYGYGGISLNIGEANGYEPEYVKSLLAEKRLKTGGFNLPFDFRGDEGAFKDGISKLPEYCAFAEKIGETRCMTWILSSHGEFDFDENFRLHRDRLRAAAEIMGAHGVMFGLEFVGTPSAYREKKYGFIRSLDGILELIDAIGAPNIGVVFDSWHWHFSGLTRADIGTMPGSSIVMVHINDAPAEIPADEQHDLTRALPGATGIIQISEFLGGLADAGYNGPVYSEPFYAPLRDMGFDGAMKAAADAIDSVWPW